MFCIKLARIIVTFAIVCERTLLCLLAMGSLLDPPWLASVVWPDAPAEASISCVAFTPLSSLLATGTHQGPVYLWQLKTLDGLLDLPSHAHPHGENAAPAAFSSTCESKCSLLNSQRVLSAAVAAGLQGASALAGFPAHGSAAASSFGRRRGLCGPLSELAFVPHLILVSEWVGASAAVALAFCSTPCPALQATGGEVLISLHSDGRIRQWSVTEGRCLAVRKVDFVALRLQTLADPRFLLVSGPGRAVVLDVWTEAAPVCELEFLGDKEGCSACCSLDLKAEAEEAAPLCAIGGSSLSVDCPSPGEGPPQTPLEEGSRLLLRSEDAFALRKPSLCVVAVQSPPPLDLDAQVQRLAAVYPGLLRSTDGFDAAPKSSAAEKAESPPSSAASQRSTRPHPQQLLQPPSAKALPFRPRRRSTSGPAGEDSLPAAKGQAETLLSSARRESGPFPREIEEGPATDEGEGREPLSPCNARRSPSPWPGSFPTWLPSPLHPTVACAAVLSCGCLRCWDLAPVLRRWSSHRPVVGAAPPPSRGTALRSVDHWRLSVLTRLPAASGGRGAAVETLQDKTRAVTGGAEAAASRPSVAAADGGIPSSAEKTRLGVKGTAAVAAQMVVSRCCSEGAQAAVNLEVGGGASGSSLLSVGSAYLAALVGARVLLWQRQADGRLERFADVFCPPDAMHCCASESPAEAEGPLAEPDTPVSEDLKALAFSSLGFVQSQRKAVPATGWKRCCLLG